MASLVPESSEIIEFSLASVAPMAALTPCPDLSLSQHTLAHRILNTSPLPSLYEAFAIIDGDEHHRRLIQALPSISLGSTLIADQMAFVAFNSGPRSSGGKSICSYRGNIGHVRERCFKLHPELKGMSSKRKRKSPPRIATVAETSPGHVPVRMC
ncbi:hypothetical protein Acr_08g0010440 [Actinidia rufa]|uniref:Uncharacterized protein n=1 Tax=Actinidia rufa TaxID=165716 RepID=A0A7J0F1S6_9ERIC|nr:hypothetical protein Acr_08g0010440 [Actinidia rufa]